MIYTDGKGMPRYISRQDARRIDQNEGRKRLIGEQVHAYKQLTAALNATMFAEEELEQRMRACKVWGQVKMAEGCLRKVKMDLAKSITVEQICTLQHDTQRCYIQIVHSQIPDKVPVDMKDLSKLVACARGLLHDESGQTHNCMTCLAALDRKAWQNCELYHLLLRMDCYIDGQYGENAQSVADQLDLKGVCPFMLGDIMRGMEDADIGLLEEI